MALAVTIRLIFSLCLIFVNLVGSASGVKEDKYYMTEDGGVMINFKKERGQLVECYTFAREAASYLMERNNIRVQQINKQRFQRLYDDCLSVQAEVIPRIMNQKRNELKERGKELRNNTKVFNTGRKMLQDFDNAERKRVGAFDLLVDEQGTRSNNQNTQHASNNGQSRNRRSVTDPTPANETEVDSLTSILLGIYPGTLWCGAGNIADYVDSPDGLGTLKGLDSCCRTHDHCDKNIAAFSSGYDLFNLSPFTCSHCDCDELFRTCLHRAPENEATLIGNIFFDLLGLDCFAKDYPFSCPWWNPFCSTRDTTAEKRYEFKDATPFNDPIAAN